MSVLFWPAPTRGEAPDLAPDRLDSRQARSLRNYLIHHPDRIVPRGKIGGPTALTDTGTLVDTTNGGTLLAVGVADDTMIATYRAPSATPLVDYWRVPINRPTNAADLAQPSLGATAGRSVDLATGTVTDIATASATSVFGPSITRCDQSLYSASFGGVSTAIATGVAPLNAIRKVAIGGAGVVLTNGPRFVQTVFTHYGRVWAAAARQPGGSDYDTSQIFYTIPGGTTALTDVVTDWQDPVTGDLQRIAVGAANDGDFVVGFGRTRDGLLVIFKRNSVWVLGGTSPSNFWLRQIRTQSGCVDFRSICVADEGTYFASQLGYELFTGDSFQLVSEPVSDTWLALSNAGVASGTVNHAYIRADAAPNGYIHLSLGTDPIVANSDDGTSKAWLFHRPTGGWIDMQTAITSLKLGSGGYLNRLVTTRSHLVAFGAAKWARCNLLTYGIDATDGVRDQDASSSYNMNLIWKTGLSNLGGYRELDGRWITATLQHCTADYQQYYTNDTPADLAAWGSFIGTDGYGTTIVPSLDLPGYDNTSPPTRVRPMYESNQETNRGDIGFTLTSNIGSSSSLRTAVLRIFGFGVMYTPGRERHL